MLTPRSYCLKTSQKQSFSKPFLTIDQQITQLKRRGMLFADEEKAKKYFENLNYYRLSGYWLLFEKDHGTHTFNANTKFEDVLKLYVFDRELRLLLLDAIERIEVSVRSRLAYELSKAYGSHPHLKPEIFHCSIKYAHTLLKLNGEVSRSKEAFIKHFDGKYREKLPPFWAGVELMTLGQVSNWFSNLKFRKDRQVVAKYYGLDEKVLVSFLHHLTIVRNICAHHSVLWNKKITLDFTVPKFPKKLNEKFNLNTRKQIFNTLVMIEYLMEVINEESHWKERLVALIEKYNIDTEHMGFKTE